MNKERRALLCLLLSLTLLFGLCACGGEKEEEASNQPVVNPKDFDPMDSYKINKTSEGQYEYYVMDYTKAIIFSRDNQPHEPTFTKLTDSILQVSAPMASTPQHRWAVFCNVQSPMVSGVFNNFLTAKGGYVAQLEQLTGQYHVFVREIFNPEGNPQVTTLPDLMLNENGYPYEKAELNEDGNLEITYNTKDGKKTVTVTMP